MCYIPNYGAAPGARGRYSNLVPRVLSQDSGNEVSKRSSRKFRIVLAVKEVTARGIGQRHDTLCLHSLLQPVDFMKVVLEVDSLTSSLAEGSWRFVHSNYNIFLQVYINQVEERPISRILEVPDQGTLRKVFNQEKQMLPKTGIHSCFSFKCGKD